MTKNGRFKQLLKAIYIEEDAKLPWLDEIVAIERRLIGDLPYREVSISVYKYLTYLKMFYKLEKEQSNLNLLAYAKTFKDSLFWKKIDEDSRLPYIDDLLSFYSTSDWNLGLYLEWLEARYKSYLKFNDIYSFEEWLLKSN